LSQTHSDCKSRALPLYHSARCTRLEPGLPVYCRYLMFLGVQKYDAEMQRRFDRPAVLVRGSEYWAWTDRHRSRTVKRSIISLSIGRLLSTDLEIMPARNEINRHAQDFVVDDELLLLIRKTFAHCTLTRHATRNA
jgi:hypothetical protein